MYRALDTKLKRDVALKVLPQAFAQDPDRLARFQREAELLAMLNHPKSARRFFAASSGPVIRVDLKSPQAIIPPDLRR